MKTLYDHNGAGSWVRYYYDRSLKVWTVYGVTAPNDEADQTTDANYCVKADLEAVKAEMLDRAHKAKVTA